MSQITIPASVIDTMFDFDIDSDDIRTDYSGRSMYGRTCLGYTGSDVVLFTFRLAVLLAREEMEDGDDPDLYTVEEKLHDLGEPRADSMGRGAIFYWPGVTVEKA
ncbi:hypothetical protein NTR1_19 [Nocardia phage NTR1]|nr:hypothetical protein NTR1_19 [Nocardia phage NTR1]